jgi:hypothetical protein
LATLEAQIEELEATIKAKERWENVEVRGCVFITRDSNREMYNKKYREK